MDYSFDLSVVTLLCAFEVMQPPRYVTLYTAPQLFDEISILCGVQKSPVLHSVVAAMVDCFFGAQFVGPACYLR